MYIDISQGLIHLQIMIHYWYKNKNFTKHQIYITDIQRCCTSCHYIKSPLSILSLGCCTKRMEEHVKSFSVLEGTFETNNTLKMEEEYRMGLVYLQKIQKQNRSLRKVSFFFFTFMIMSTVFSIYNGQWQPWGPLCHGLFRDKRKEIFCKIVLAIEKMFEVNNS